MKNEFVLIVIAPTGEERVLGNPMTETEADTFRKAHEGGVGSQCGYSYVVRPFNINITMNSERKAIK